MQPVSDSILLNHSSGVGGHTAKLKGGMDTARYFSAVKQYKAFNPFSITFLLDCDINCRVKEFKLRSDSAVGCKSKYI